VTESQRRENSIFPSASVGTPLQVAGRYRQVRTVRSTLRSPAGPALCRIRGLCTRPSAPTMKLTFTFDPAPAGTSRGSGVVSACGGRVSSQRERALTCGMSLNSAARRGVFQSWRSRSTKTAWCWRGDGTWTEAVLGAGSVRINSQGQIRSMREAFQARRCRSCTFLHRQLRGQLNAGISILLSVYLGKPAALRSSRCEGDCIFHAEWHAWAGDCVHLKVIVSPKAEGLAE